MKKNNIAKLEKIQYANDDFESIRTLIRLRAPALIIGLLLGIALSFITSNFEKVLAQNVQVAFFLPFVVYIADAIGTQTESIFSRDLRTGKAQFYTYLRKEFILGLIFGSIFAAFTGTIVLFWLKDQLLAATVAIASLIAIATAPLIALLVTQTFQCFRKDPAASSGPITTVIQDVISVLIYGIVANMIIL